MLVCWRVSIFEGLEHGKTETDEHQSQGEHGHRRGARHHRLTLRLGLVERFVRLVHGGHGRARSMRMMIVASRCSVRDVRRCRCRLSSGRVGQHRRWRRWFEIRLVRLNRKVRLDHVGDLARLIVAPIGLAARQISIDVRLSTHGLALRIRCPSEMPFDLARLPVSVRALRVVVRFGRWRHRRASRTVAEARAANVGAQLTVGRDVLSDFRLRVRVAEVLLDLWTARLFVMVLPVACQRRFEGVLRRRQTNDDEESEYVVYRGDHVYAVERVSIE